MAATTLPTLVNDVVQHVNGSYVGAGNAVRTLINADTNTRLSSHEVHRIMQAAVQDENTTQADIFVWALTPLEYGNQLRGDNGDWSYLFFQKYQGLIIDGQLGARFVTAYNLV
jgi:hypothetical protein